MDEFLDKAAEEESADSETSKLGQKLDKRDTIEKSDAAGSAHIADSKMDLPADELRTAFARFKRLADERKAVTLYDVFDEVSVP